MYCQKCGKMISDQAAFCRFCGSKVVRVQKQNDPQTSQSPGGPGNGSYGQPGGPGNGSYGQPGRPENGVYGQPGRPGNGVYRQPGRPGNGVYGQPGGPENGSYGQSATPGNGSYGQQIMQGNGTYGQQRMPGNGMYGQQGFPANGMPNQPQGNMQYQTSPAGNMHARPMGNIYDTTRPHVDLNGGMQMAGRAAGSGARAVREASKIKLLALIAAVLVAIAVMLYIFFFKAGTPEDTIAKMEDALNHLDQEELLECFDDQTQQLYAGALSVGGSLSGLDLDGLSDLASGLGGLMAGTGLTPRFTLDVVDVEYTDSDNCLVTVDFTVTFQGETQVETQQLPMTKDGRNWVVSMAAAQDIFY